jgi:hypothetical protein
MAAPTTLALDAQDVQPARPYASLPASLWGAFGALALLGLLTANPLLTATSIMLLPVFMTLLWRPGETPVLLFAVSFQWLQVTAKVFHANVLGIDVTELSEYALVDLPSIERAVWLGLIGLVVLAAGMRLGMWKLSAGNRERAQTEADWFSPDRAFILYLILAAVDAVLEAYVWSFGGLVQVIRAALGIKWVAFFILGYVVLKRRERYPFFLIAVLIEFVGGIGFFSGFKTVIFVTLIIAFTVRYQLKPGVIALATVLLAFLLLLGVGWTSIKMEYRAYLNQGTGQQTVAVSPADQFQKLGELVGELDGHDLGESVGQLFGRIAYVDYLALVLDYVPSYTPHEEGGVWGKSVMHVLTPRALFPDKPPLPSDSELTMQYTGLHLASDSQGTSISIGYMGESYVDFGPYGMFIPVFILGVMWGLMYTFFVSRARYAIIGYGFATALLLNAYQFEMASIKLLGGVLMKFMVLALVMYLAERYVGRWLQRREQSDFLPRGTLAQGGERSYGGG